MSMSPWCNPISICPGLFGRVYVHLCVWKDVPSSCVCLSPTRSPNRASPAPCHHANRWQPNESWGDTPIAFTTAHAVTWRLTSLGRCLNIGLSQRAHAHTWRCCFVAQKVLRLTFAPRSHVFRFVCCSWSASERDVNTLWPLTLAVPVVQRRS